MARALIIGPEVTAKIKDVVAYAEANVISFETLRAGAVPNATSVLSLKDRKPGFERPKSAHVDIPNGFRAAFSIEEQPAGLCRHLSVSVDKKGKTPSEHAVWMICSAFGMAPPYASIWLEEFEPGHHAVNVLQVVRERQAGHA